MNCSQIAPLLESYLHLELDPGRMRNVQMHLMRCRSCQGEMRNLRITADVVVPFYLAALAHGELSPAERRVVEEHIAWCDACRAEAESISMAAAEMAKIFSQHRLSLNFHREVMQAWQPHRLGQRPARALRGLADAIARAEAGGNIFSYERLVERFKDYAYAAAFLQTGDFNVAEEICRQIFIDGLPLCEHNISPAEFHGWLERRAAEIARQRLAAASEEKAEGLKEFRASRKLRRYRLLLALINRMPEGQSMLFLLYYVHRRSYQELSAMLDLPRAEVMGRLLDATRLGRDALEADSQAPSAALPTAAEVVDKGERRYE